MAKAKKLPTLEVAAVEAKPSVEALSNKLAEMLNQPAPIASDAKAPEKKTTKSSVFTGTMFILGGKAQLEIKCYNAAEADKVERNNLHKDCLGKIKNGGKTCSKCSADITSDDLVVKGVEVGKGKYVTLSDEEVAKLKPIKDCEMYVTAYVTPESVDLTYVEDSEFVCIDPDSKNPRKEVYDAFVEGMKRSNRYGQGVRVKGGREQYFVVRPYQGGMMLHHLFAEYEVRNCNKFQTPEPVSEELVQTIAAYMEAETKDFVPAKYDSFLGNVRNLIQAKANNQTVADVTPKATPAPTADLMAALKESLSKAKAAGK
jgi:DNA end-binding protein Ku